jgi:hypothetical protein
MQADDGLSAIAGRVILWYLIGYQYSSYMVLFVLKTDPQMVCQFTGSFGFV